MKQLKNRYSRYAQLYIKKFSNQQWIKNALRML